MRRLLFALLSTVLFAAGTIRLYMKDGQYHLVREYQVLSDRVKFYSTERGEWEEMPLDLIDLKRTQEEVKANEEEAKLEQKAEKEEKQAEREQRREIASVPDETGAYWLSGKELKALKVGEVKYVLDKKRQVLKFMSPIPMVPGKAQLETDGPNSAFVIKEERPEFYFRLAREERLAIIKLPLSKNKNRIVEKIAIAPVVNELIEELVEVDSYRRQVGELLFKIWPTKPLEPGEYAVIEYSPAVDGKYSLQIWDFAIAK